MSATWRGVNAELTTRGQGVVNESNGKIWLSEGFRTRAEQEAFYAKYLAGGALAAKPGTSQHEKGLAIDLACASKDNALRAALAAKWGLKRTVASELWHFELDPARKPLATPAPAPKPVQPAVVFQNAFDIGDTVKKQQVHFTCRDDKCNPVDKGYFETGIPFDKFVTAHILGPRPEVDGWGWSAPTWEPVIVEGQTRILVRGNLPHRELDIVLVFTE